MKMIRGSGGSKGGGGGGGVEVPDSLRSNQIARYIDAICEGEIVGLVDGLKSVYINDTPLQNADGSLNFGGIQLQYRNGTIDQEPMDGFGEVETEQSVGVEVKKAVPIVRTITNSNVDSVRVTIGVGSLMRTDDQGNINGTVVDYQIAIQDNLSGFQTVVTDRISGKTLSHYRRSHRIPLTGVGPWDVRVTKLTDDSTSTKLSNSLYFDALTGIVSSKLAYPNTAMVGIAIDARQFSQVPTRGYHIKGKIIRVPSNYDPKTREYTGVWDGTFKMAYSNNPAWCFYDLLTAKRYGLGKYLDEASIDRWELYAIGKYCDQLVPDGRGGIEPRFTCNLALQSREEAFKVVQNMASIFRGISYWGAAGVVAVQDRPADPVALFTNANVIGGEFSYSGTSLKSRHTVALVSWNDPDDMYRQKVEYVQDDEGVRRYGVIPSEVAGFGCASRGQAARAGKWLLATERAEDETVTFKAGYDSTGLYPGAIISTSDINRTLARFSGRICSCTLTNVEMDAPVKFKSGVPYQILVTMPDGTLQSRGIVPRAGETASITVSPPFDAVPLVDATFAITEGQAEPEQWRVIGLKEEENAEISVTALKYNRSKYGAVEYGLKLDDLPISNLRATPEKPVDLKFIVYNKDVDGEVSSLCGTLSWSGSTPDYIVRWRYEREAWYETNTQEQSIDFPDLRIGKYTFVVSAVNALGLTSKQSVLEFDVTPQAIKLPNVTGLALEGRWDGNVAKFKWEAVKGATGYTVRVIVGGQVKREVAVGDALRFDYNAADMQADGGPWRSFDVSVKATGKWGSESDWATITVGNPQAAMPMSIEVTAGIKSGYVTATPVPEPDLAGMIVWVSTEQSCPPVASNQIYDGAIGMVLITKLPDDTPLDSSVEYYVRVAFYDSFGKDSLNVSSSVPFRPFLVDIGPDTITETEIKDDSISTPKLRAGSVTGDKVLANTITGQHIVGQSITGHHIKAGTVSTDVLVSGIGSGNLIPNASFASQFTDSAGRKQPTEWTYWTNKFTNMLYAIDFAGAAWVPPGMYGMAIYQPDKAFAGSDAIAVMYSEPIPVVAGAWYEASCYVASHRCSSYISGTFYNAAHQLIGSFFSPACPPGVQGGTDLNNYRRLFTLAQAPAGASYVRFELRHNPTEASATAPNDNSYSFFVRPYFGVATGSGQTQPSPWAAPGIGTQIHGGALKTGTVTADRMAVGSLSAISANLGYCTAGEVHGGKFHGGAFNGNYAWPASGGGFHLSEHGLLLGNANTGGYFQLQSNGDMYTPGMTLVGGTLTINQLRVIKSANIARDAISRAYSYTTLGDNPVSLTVIAHDECTAIIAYSSPILEITASSYAGRRVELTGAATFSVPWISAGPYMSGGFSKYINYAVGCTVRNLSAGSHAIYANAPGRLDVLLVFR